MTFIYPIVHSPRGIRLLKYKKISEDRKTLEFSLETKRWEVPEIKFEHNRPVLSKNSNRLAFYALSYVWGTSPDKEVIICNGAPVEITRNLYDALFQLIVHMPGIELWTDSLCINQNDAVEKPAQVAMMGDLYACATEVVCWLGTATLSDPLCDYQAAIDTFQKIRARHPPDEEYPSCASCAGSVFRLGLCKDRTHQEIADQCDGLQELISAMESSRWFERVWTFQEFILASKVTVHLGPYAMPWRYFALASYEMNRSHYKFSSSFGMSIGVSEIRKLNEFHNRFWNGRGISLAEAIEQVRIRNTTVHHDKLYAVMGLSSRTRSSSIKVDYSISLSQLYAMFTRFSVLEDANPGVLLSITPGRAGQPQDPAYPKLPRCPDLPTWAIDWSRDRLATSSYHINVGTLPDLASIGGSLGLYSVVIGYLPTDDYDFLKRTNCIDSPSFRRLPDCIDGHNGLKDSLTGPQFRVSQCQWAPPGYLVADIEQPEKLPQTYMEPASLLGRFDSHQLGWMAASVFVVELHCRKSSLLGEYKWNVSWRDGYRPTGEDVEGYVLYEYPCILSPIAF
ncbi:unnamed protein product [Clonostachys byssicola]|uniref:Heterokaryon incompatibility domain-containing protein n=1 Tax=Clonostachys byssicola TaxID=160290 RepID=A0A9N9Y067_9HYPO|nr:unnamed protein product [Clonostachys byssicola]